MPFGSKSHLRENLVKTRVDCQAADDGKTEQAHKDEVSVQSIVKRAMKGEMADKIANVNWGVDTIGQPQYDEAQNIIARTKAYFEELPSRIRNLCNNNPGNFLEFYTDEKNRDVMKELGMDVSHLPEPVIKPATEEPVVKPAATTAKVSESEPAPDKKTA